ncbi:MAG: NADPH-dependent glutamate synthase [Bacteroidales bacterium]|jgi:glutamate synthase (NADPH/NADH) small chain|nr:NADPH-dependent glutamate synthase [Bacteroidales bacterium]
MDRFKKIDVKVLSPEIRKSSFEEVCLGYSEEEAVLEANRCLLCKKPACVQGCPVSIDIPGFIAKIKEGDLDKAGEIVFDSSTLPAICGRVCPQESQCEGKCVLSKKGDPVSIGKLERFIADYTNINNSLKIRKNTSKGLKVAVVGSGPSGLSCAGELAKAGYDVTIFEALHKPGGVLEYGIPEFRLPKEKVVKKEIQNLKNLGVKIETDVIIGRTITVENLMKEEDFKAVYLASGAGLPKFMGIPGENLNGVFSANEVLTRANLMKAFRDDYDTPVFVGKKVIVVGGGNVAMDAARTALRFGAEVHVVYRRGLEELPARVEEVHHAQEEGVIFNVLCNPLEIIGSEDGWVKAVKCIRMELGEPDSSGRRRPQAIEDSEFIIEADSVIMSLGTSPNPIINKNTKGLQLNKWECIEAEEVSGQTSIEGVFAGGDAVTGAATVILAMGAGKNSAAAIDKYLTDKYLTK